MRILVIDDRVENLEAARRQLGEEHEVILVSGFGEAKNIIRDCVESFDMLLTDLMLPEIWGAPKTNSEQPFGLLLVLSAIKERVGYVGMLTSSYHHDNQIVMGMTGLLLAMPSDGVSEIGDTKCILIETTKPEKDWRYLFGRLTGDIKPEIVDESRQSSMLSFE